MQFLVCVKSVFITCSLCRFKKCMQRESRLEHRHLPLANLWLQFIHGCEFSRLNEYAFWSCSRKWTITLVINNNLMCESVCCMHILPMVGQHYMCNTNFVSPIEFQFGSNAVLSQKNERRNDDDYSLSFQSLLEALKNFASDAKVVFVCTWCS